MFTKVLELNTIIETASYNVYGQTDVWSNKIEFNESMKKIQKEDECLGSQSRLQIDKALVIQSQMLENGGCNSKGLL